MFKPVVYADDSTLFSSLNVFGSESNSISFNISAELTKFSNWMKLNKLSLNYSKTKAMLFHMPQKRICYPDIFLDSNKIELVNEFNFLGFQLDYKLSWTSHINNISTKIAKVTGIIHRLKNFLPQNILQNIYNALILPHLNYGSLLWQKQSNKLLILQKKAVRAITCSKYNAHTNKLFKELKILKCDDICALHAYTFCYKLENGILPEYFYSGIFTKVYNVHNYFIRNINDYLLPVVRHDYAKCGLRFKIPKFFNEMDWMIQSKIYTHSLQGFKLYVKKKLMNKYLEICNIANCFVCSRT